MTDTPKLNLRQKLVKVYSLIDHVEKAGNNEKQRYRFVRAADVLRAVRDAFEQLGIYAQTNYELLGTYDIKTNSGGNMHTATVRATIVLHDTDSEETLTISGLGDGADGGDKGIYKAQTGAIKNALRNGLLLPDEADPEADEDVDTRTTGAYAHPSSTTEMPDFQDARHAAPTPNPAPKSQKPAETPKASPKAPQQAPGASAISAAGSPATASEPNIQQYSDFKGLTESLQEKAPERGDAYEEPEVSKLPTEEELVGYREKFAQLANELSAHGKLTASKGLKLNTKLMVFFLSITKADAAKNATVAQWDNFFARAKAAIDNPAVGLVGLTKLINAANGLETKK